MNVNAVVGLLDRAPLWSVVALYAVLSIIVALVMRMLVLSAIRTIRILAAHNGTGSGIFYAAAVAGMFVSLNTSWNFFGERLDVQNLVERGVMFFVLELAQLACGWGMRASICKPRPDGSVGTPGPARLIAWALCAVSAYMAWSLSGFWIGIARVILGPVLSLVMLHLALGIEVRGLRVNADSTWVRLAREFRERFLSLFGLGDEGRDAKTIAQKRALRRALYIRTAKKSTARNKRRFIQLLAKSGARDTPEAWAQFLEQMQLATNADLGWGADYGNPFPVAHETAAETPAETEQASTTETVAETVETPVVKPVTLTAAKAEQEAEIATLFQLMTERGSAESVKLPEAQGVLPARLGRATVARRLAEARKRFTQAS